MLNMLANTFGGSSKKSSTPIKKRASLDFDAGSPTKEINQKRIKHTISQSQSPTKTNSLNNENLLQPLKQRKSVFMDMIYTHITVDGICLEIIDTPEYKRLKGLKQLGNCDKLFPSAIHTRFEHSIGVMYLADKLVSTIRDKQPELNITDNDLLCVKIAGLCHDLGHGPFSHVFDGVFIKRIYPNGIDGNGKKWRHEDGSVAMLHYLLEKNNINLIDKCGLTELDCLFIDEIISGTEEEDRKGRDYSKFYLYDVVNNSRSGLDVDKLDYFQRDMFMTLNAVCKVSYERFINSAKVMPAMPINNNKDKDRNAFGLSQDRFASPVPKQRYNNDKIVSYPMMICYPEKLVVEAVELFRTRFKMHESVYTNKTVKKHEYMTTDALVEADEFITIYGTKTDCFPDGKYKMSECIFDMCAYSKLNDSILDYIVMKYDEDARLKKSYDIITNMKKRIIYASIGRTTYLKDEEVHKKTEEMILDEILEIVNCLEYNCDDSDDNDEMECYSPNNFRTISQNSNESDSIIINKDDIIVEKMHIHYGLGDKNPVARMRFFVKNDDKILVAKEVNERSYESSLPKVFESRAIRVFCRNSTPAIHKRIANAFSKWCKRVRTSTPFPSYSQPYDDECSNSAF